MRWEEYEERRGLGSERKEERKGEGRRMEEDEKREEEEEEHVPRFCRQLHARLRCALSGICRLLQTARRESYPPSG